MSSNNFLEATNDGEPVVRAADLPVGTRFKLAAFEKSSWNDTWLTMLPNRKARVGEATGGERVRHEQTVGVPDDSVVLVAISPDADSVEQQLATDRKANRNRDAFSGRIPEWGVRLVQAETLDKARSFIDGRPVLGPRKNSLDRDYKTVAWQDVPFDSFCVLSQKVSLEENPTQRVYAKVADHTCIPVCTLQEWVSGKFPRILCNQQLEKNIDELGMTEGSMVTVLNAPTAAQEQEAIEDYRLQKKRAGEEVDDKGNQHLARIQALADNYESAV